MELHDATASIVNFIYLLCLSVVAQSESEVILAFCPRDRRRTGIEGTMQIMSDSGFIAAVWSYWNPDRHRELAGGEVSFAPPENRPAIGKVPLLASSGFFWRRLPTGRFYQLWFDFEKWMLYE